MKTFVVVEPNGEVCQFMVEILSLFLKRAKDEAKVIDFLSFDEALVKFPSIEEVTIVFLAFDAPVGKCANVAGEFKRVSPKAKVILMSTFDAHEEAQQLGLDDFVSKLDFVTIGTMERLLQKHGAEL